MTEADALFAKAYDLNVVEEQHEKAISICRQALELEPNNYRVRVYLGMLLSDYGTAEQQEEGRKHFLEGITVAKDNPELCDNWFEESGLHNLAIWEWKHGDRVTACLLFLADVLTCHSKESYEYLFKLIDEIIPKRSTDLKIVLAKIANLESSRSRDTH